MHEVKILTSQDSLGDCPSGIEKVVESLRSRKLSYNLNRSCKQSFLELHSYLKSEQAPILILTCSSKERFLVTSQSGLYLNHCSRRLQFLLLASIMCATYSLTLEPSLKTRKNTLLCPTLQLKVLSYTNFLVTCVQFHTIQYCTGTYDTSQIRCHPVFRFANSGGGCFPFRKSIFARDTLS